MMLIIVQYINIVKIYFVYISKISLHAVTIYGGSRVPLLQPLKV